VQAYTLRHVRAQGAGIVAGFAEITNRTQAEGLRGLELFIPREALADAALEPGAHFQADLIGLRVTTAQAVMVGVVVGMQNYGAGDLLEIQPQQGSTFLVPYQDVAILGIDLAQNELILDPAFLPD
jgi:16S rRNA processing protein RimM